MSVPQRHCHGPPRILASALEANVAVCARDVVGRLPLVGGESTTFPRDAGGSGLGRRKLIEKLGGLMKFRQGLTLFPENLADAHNTVA